MDNLSVIFKAVLITAVSANLEGPFLFWGPLTLREYTNSALQTMEQDDLIKIYEKQAAIVVFNNQDSSPLSGESFPRLRKLLERQALLVLPQDFLDVHPDYINNETLVLTLQGPSSVRDAEITETFNRLEDIYGSGRVLGILGNSVSADYNEADRRLRRAAADEDMESTTPSREQKQDKPEKALQEYALYNATSPAAFKALIYSSKWPLLRMDSGDEIQFKRPITATVDQKPPRDSKAQLTKVVVTFLHDNAKISLHFRFTTSGGWWYSSGVEVHLKNSGLLLQPPPGRSAPSAVLGKSYHCTQTVSYTGQNATLYLYDMQMQPFMDKAHRFADAFDCVGFTTEPIWSGTIITIFLNLVLFVALMMIFDIKTNDRYENSKGKALVITVTE